MDFALFQTSPPGEHLNEGKQNTGQTPSSPVSPKQNLLEEQLKKNHA